jgi:hypothetical protein
MRVRPESSYENPRKDKSATPGVPRQAACSLCCLTRAEDNERITAESTGARKQNCLFAAADSDANIPPLRPPRILARFFGQIAIELLERAPFVTLSPACTATVTTIPGIATSGTDFHELSDSVLISAGASSA